MVESAPTLARTPAPTQAPTLANADQLRTELRHVPILEDLSEETMEWLLSHIEQQAFAVGEATTQEGQEADRLTIILEGEVRGALEKEGNDRRIYTARAGMVTGLLPYSRLTHWPLTARTTAPTRLAWIMKEHFPEMIATLPTLVTRLVGVMSDRIRESTTEQQQRDKLISLGRLSAGLAHELNNPASAAQRSTEALRETMRAMRQANVSLQQRELSVDQRQFLAKLEATWDQTSCPQELTSIERCDLEDTFGEWLQAHGVEDGWTLAPSLVEASCDLVMLNALAEKFEGPALADALAKLAASFSISRLVGEIENATRRISDLVKAVKEYSYMDQAPEQEVNIHTLLDNTLAMMQHRLTEGIEVRREYDRSLPCICAFGGELNQVWTNLIDNALDAMDGTGILTIHTGREFGKMRIDICDTGRGIEDGIKGKIFDPFFTTKRVGQGTGLGLDTVFRIVKKHEGDVKFESKPGETKFQVYLPFERAGRADV